MKIGFVDYYLSEWHANNYPAWMRAIASEEKKDVEIAYAWAEENVSPVDGKTTDEWCAEFGVKKCETVEELCEKSDVIVVLAPSDPDTHLRLCEKVFPYGKRTYVDKTFAPDGETAKKIFSLAEKYGTPFFSTSALRFATELGEVENVRRLLVTGGGRLVEEYLIHCVEMIVSTIGVGASFCTAKRIGEEEELFEVFYPDDRKATVTFARRLPFTAYMVGEGKPQYREIKSEYFQVLMRKILHFFETGEVPFDPAETLEVMRVRDAVLAARVSGKEEKIER